MRKIIVRVWDTTSDKTPLMDYCSLERAGDYHQYLDHEIMQFTGLLDTNGKEIYEHDILEGGVIVRFGGYTAYDSHLGAKVYPIGFYLENPSEEKDAHQFALENKDGYYLVVGNIYQNPELLKKVE